MRTQQLEVKECSRTRKDGRIENYWMLDTRENGKRVRKFYKAETEAKKELARIKTKIRNEGKDALSLSDSLRVSALRISRELEPYGKTLDDAGAFYLKFLRNSTNSISVERLVAEFMGDQVRQKHSPKHIEDLKGRLGRFSETF